MKTLGRLRKSIILIETIFWFGFKLISGFFSGDKVANVCLVATTSCDRILFAFISTRIRKRNQRLILPMCDVNWIRFGRALTYAGAMRDTRHNQSDTICSFGIFAEEIVKVFLRRCAAPFISRACECVHTRHIVARCTNSYVSLFSLSLSLPHRSFNSYGRKWEIANNVHVNDVQHTWLEWVLYAL